MAVGLEQTLVLPPREKEIGWLGEALGLLPERLRIVDQNLLALDLYETEEMKVLHLVRAVDLVRESISALRTRTAGSAGFRALRASRSSMSRWISGLVVGQKSFRNPDGMVRLAASRSTLLKLLTAE